jgi:adenosylmethionine-8-amino-7-oxononanoate aminotransferase
MALSARTRRLIQLDKQHVWHPFTQMKDWLADPEPLVIERGQGSLLIDTEGRRYIDGVSSLWVNVHGHRKRELDQAVRRQLGRLAHSTLLGLANVPSVELAAELIAIAPKGLSKVFYSDAGSTAVEIALKIAYQYWANQGRPRKRFITLKEAYHGDTVGSVSLGGVDLFHAAYKPLLFKTDKLPAPYCYRCPLKKRFPSCKLACLGPLKSLLAHHGNTVAAVVLEPAMMGAAGMLAQPKGYLKRVERLARQAGTLLVLDEVATGFGRTGKMWACQHEDVRPDLMACAKGLTGGYLPLAATLATDKVYQGFVRDFSEAKTFFHGHTYTGNPLACAAALANLRLFKSERTLARLAPRVRRLASALKPIAKLKHVGDVRQRGFMAGIELVRDRASQEPYGYAERMGAQACSLARRHGVLLRPLGNVVVLMPPLNIPIPLLDRLVEVTHESIRQATEGA